MVLFDDDEDVDYWIDYYNTHAKVKTEISPEIQECLDMFNNNPNINAEVTIEKTTPKGFIIHYSYAENHSSESFQNRNFAGVAGVFNKNVQEFSHL